MKTKGHLLGSFLLFLLSVFLPWFTFNAKIMGYCWGWHFLKWLVCPIVSIIVFLFCGKGRMLTILAELSVVMIFAVYVIAFGRWQEYFNIAPGFQWLEGFYTATAGYWISLSVFLLFAVLLQIQVFSNKKMG